MLATTASTALTILESSPQLFSTLEAHMSLLRATLDPLEAIHIPSHPLSPLIHIQLAGAPPTSMAEIESEEALLQEVVDETLRNGVLVTRARRLRGQERFEIRPSIKVCLTSALSRKEVEKAAGTLKTALAKVLKKRS
jgi:serine palmitoyltransferase